MGCDNYSDSEAFTVKYSWIGLNSSWSNNNYWVLKPNWLSSSYTTNWLYIVDKSRDWFFINQPRVCLFKLLLSWGKYFRNYCLTIQGYVLEVVILHKKSIDKEKHVGKNPPSAEKGAGGPGNSPRCQFYTRKPFFPL